jgi:eukaryotic-like serine/threonine-protein kinase
VQKIGKFEILAALGRGAMGTVYRARDPVLDRPVALKTVAPELLSNVDALARFQREARAAARLQHPNIVTIYELGNVEGALFIAMELLEGMDLAEAMTPPGRLALPQKLRIVVDICRGLDFAHKRGVFHRDVKPANIRLLQDGSVKLVDFGIARLENSTMTQTGMMLGTPSYMAPEVLRGHRVDHRADMWAVGVVLYELLTGERPFDAPTIAALIYNIVHTEPPPVDAAALGVPDGITAILERALAKDPGGRYRDLAEMADALQLVLGLTPTGERSMTSEVREASYQLNFEEARRLLADDDLEGALSAARRAQALEPSRTAVIALIKLLEERLQEAPTLIATPPPFRRGERGAATPATAGGRTLPSVPPPAWSVTQVLAELRTRGADAFRELAVFGEPPATTTAIKAPAADAIATAGTDGAIRIWDLRSRMKTATFRTQLHERSGHDAVAVAIAFSPDGRLMASGHVDGSVHLWDRDQVQELPCRLRHEAGVSSLMFSPDGAILASGGLDSNLKLWNVEAASVGEARRELHRQPASVTGLAYVEGGTRILTGHANRTLRLADAATGRLLATLRGPAGPIGAIAPTPDGRRFLACSQDRTLRLFDVPGRREVFAVPGHPTRATTGMAFFPDGIHFATVAQDNAVRLWELERGTTIAVLWGQSAESFAGLALFGVGDHVAAALSDGRIRVWGPAL